MNANGDFASKLSRTLAFALLYVLLMAAVYWLHSRFLRVDVVLYSAIADAVLAGALLFAALRMAGALAPFNRFERMQLLAGWLLLGYALAISVPTGDRPIPVLLHP